MDVQQSHTPGPWFVSSDREQRDVISPGCVVATAGNMGCAFGYAESERSPHVVQAQANARLISAAPDLLTETAEVCAILDNYSGHDGEALVYDYAAIGEEVARRHQSLTDALLKAKGGQS